NFKYQVFVTNLPKSDIGNYPMITNITVNLFVILEHIWDTKVKWSVPKYKENGDLVITIEFEPEEFSDQYKVSICSPDLHPDAVYSTLPPVVRSIIILTETPSSDSSTCAKGKLEWDPIQEPKRVIIIYSLDHPLYKEIILKLCAFMRAKCGTDITLDLLDSAWLSTIGRIQWLDMQRERISKSSDKVLILCSPGVHAKWKAMCGEHKVRLKEDERSPIGDMLTPALSLIIPDFVHASSFHKYMVAYFDDVCSEDDVPAPFNVVVKYKLMKHFEELYFRILDMEKHEPGQIKCIEGIRENDYICCPSGQGLRDAIEAFKNYQLKNPNWFEMELLDTDDEEEETILESTFPTDINYSSVTECHHLIILPEMLTDYNL
uniref:Interleukin-17 receptor A-like n=1 Tax=Sinocyclocheilus grahami TaxID=75366 RepID=A0A672SEE3_SINGR